MTPAPRTKSKATPESTPAAFDLNDLAMAESIRLDLTAPHSTAPTGFWVEVYSPRTEPVQSVDERHPLKFKDGKLDITEDAFRERSMARLVAATKAWNLVLNGEPVPCTPEKIREIYTSPRFGWIGDQVGTTLADTTRFFPTARTSS